jgi:hypothetical protein
MLLLKVPFGKLVDTVLLVARTAGRPVLRQRPAIGDVERHPTGLCSLQTGYRKLARVSHQSSGQTLGHRLCLGQHRRQLAAGAGARHDDLGLAVYHDLAIVAQ